MSHGDFVDPRCRRSPARVAVNRLRRAVVVGYPYYARYVAQLVETHGERWDLEPYASTRMATLRALWAIRSADALVAVGGPGPGAMLAEAAAACRTPVAVMWVGSDVLAATHATAEPVAGCETYHATDARWLADELRPLGIDARYLPLTSADCTGDVAPLPAAFKVLTYLPEPKRIFYGEGRVYALARAMPGVEFVVIGRGSFNPDAPRNVTFRGHVADVAAQIDASTVLLRLADHDGQSMLVLEALARGRHVVWNYEFPGVRIARTTDAALAALQALERAHAAHALETNDIGRAYVRRNFAPADVAFGIESFLDEITVGPSRLGNRVSRRAITGDIDALGRVFKTWRANHR